MTEKNEPSEKRFTVTTRQLADLAAAWEEAAKLTATNGQPPRFPVTVIFSEAAGSKLTKEQSDKFHAMLQFINGEAPDGLASQPTAPADEKNADWGARFAKHLIETTSLETAEAAKIVRNSLGKNRKPGKRR
jgi:hypothetical protein